MNLGRPSEYPRILLVEDMDDHAAMVARAAPGVAWDRARNEREARRKILHAVNRRTDPYDAVFLDYDLNGVTGGGGEKVAALLIHTSYDGLVVVHSGNPMGGPYMVNLFAQHGYDSVYAPKFWNTSPDVWHAAVEHLRRNMRVA